MAALFLLTAGFAGTAVATEASQSATGAINATITDTSQTYEAAVAGNTTYVWGSTVTGNPVNATLLEVTVDSPGTATQLCVNQSSSTCVDLGNASTATFSLSLSEADQPTTFSITLRNASTGETLDTTTRTVHQISRTTDLDGDGLTNIEEVRAGATLTERDSDSDGLRDLVEVRRYGTAPNAADTDGDGLSDRVEVSGPSDPLKADTDGDGLNDSRERKLGTNLTSIDTDGDGLTDAKELSLGTIPTKADSDGDGLSDWREHRIGTDPLTADSDGDGLTDRREVRIGTSPLETDTDGDGLSDQKEVSLGTDPRVTDSDSDGLADSKELTLGTDPLDADTDDDSVADGAELELGTEPQTADTDGDGLSDGKERAVGSDPTVADTDNDGVLDASEVAIGSSPLEADSDGDGLPDKFETTIGTNPSNDITPVLMFSGGFGFIIGVVFMTIRTGHVSAAIDRFYEQIGAVELVQPLLGPVSTGGAAGPVADDTQPPSTTDSGQSSAEASTNLADRSGDGGRPESAADVIETAETDLLTNEEVVLEMLRVEDGQMKQSEIVSVTEWSKAKVSRLLSRMADGEDAPVVKVSIGRENLVCLESATPSAIEQSAGTHQPVSLWERSPTS